jgi:zinc protease
MDWHIQNTVSRLTQFIVVFAGVLVLGLAAAGAVTVQQITSPGGIVAWLVEDHSIPLTAIEFSFRGGAALDPEHKDGLANLVAGLLDEGAGDLDSQSFQGRLYDLSVSLSFSAGFDTFRGSLKTLNRHRDEAIDMLRLALTQPRFDAEPVERIRQQVLTSIRRRSNDPDRIASQTLWRAVFADHPYGRPLRGNEKSVSAITVDDIRSFVERRIAKDTLIVGAVGYISASELAIALDTAFGNVPDVAASSLLQKANEAAGGQTFVIEQDVPQSVISFSQPGLARDDADYYVAYVMNYILGGGGFSSRLYEEVREKRGLAYSVYSYMNSLDAGALIAGGVSTVNARAGESLAVIRAEWARMRDSGVTQEELDDATRYLTGSWPLSFDNTGQMARRLVGMQYNYLGIDYLDRRNDYITAVRLEDINRVARRVLDPSKFTVVVVGKPEGIVATAEAPDLKE